ncbi:MAG TPA: ABC transporter permease [Actinomycetota bacterium]|jgi:peptide/nickel transport system permease protein|nr:ABC transporter permease [Actinomycetota bacterium]
MGRLIARRLAFMVFVVWGVTLVTFFLSRVVPGDPAKLLAGPKASPAEVAHIRRIYGLDDPLWTQYVRYMADLAHGNLGVSFVTRREVTTDVRTFLPATLELAGYSLLLGFLAALIVGSVAGYRRGSAFDAGGRLMAIAGLSVPAFWLALLLQLLLHTHLGWFPLGGRLDAGVAPPPRITGILTLDSLLTFHLHAFANALWHLALPVLTLAAGVFGLMTRIVRTSILEVVGEDYVRTAEAKGLTRWRVLRRHVLRNAMLPAVTVLGLEFGLLASGVFVVEAVFQWPGLGNYAFQAIQASDYNATLGATLVIAIAYVITNLIVDLAYLYLDPRIRYT